MANQNFEGDIIKKKITIVSVIMLLCVFGLAASFILFDSSKEFWGSYTAEKTYSYDHKLYAIQTVNDNMIIVTVYNAETDEELNYFSPARASDFWGICWEKDSYNIWTQSADIGTYCFEYRNEKWICNDSIKKPNYIISRYDEKYRNNPELWDSIYQSPTE